MVWWNDECKGGFARRSESVRGVRLVARTPRCGSADPWKREFDSPTSHFLPTIPVSAPFSNPFILPYNLEKNPSQQSPKPLSSVLSIQCSNNLEHCSTTSYHVVYSHPHCPHTSVHCFSNRSLYYTTDIKCIPITLSCSSP